MIYSCRNGRWNIKNEKKLFRHLKNSEFIIETMVNEKEITMSGYIGPEDDIEFEIRLGLIDDCEDAQNRAFARAFNEWKHPVAGFVKNDFPDFTPAQLKDVVAETFLSFREAVSKETFDFEKPVFGLLLTIARRRGVDECRKVKTPVIENDDDFVKAVYERLCEGEMNDDWKEIVNKGYVEEIELEFRKFVNTLPVSQRKIARVIADALPEILSPSEISDELLRQTGEMLTAVQIKGRLQTLRAKFGEILEKRLQPKRITI